MSKKKGSRKRTKTRSSQGVTPGGKVKKSRKLKGLSQYFNIARFLLCLVVVIVLVNANKGYDRLYEKDLLRAVNDFKKYGDNTMDQRLGLLIGKSYQFFQYINQNTPEDAVILFPPSNEMKNKGRENGFGNWMGREDYITYFLYPRKVVFANTSDDNPLKKGATHVAIFANLGRDLVNYPVAGNLNYAVVPKQKAVQ